MKVTVQYIDNPCFKSNPQNQSDNNNNNAGTKKRHRESNYQLRIWDREMTLNPPPKIQVLVFQGPELSTILTDQKLQQLTKDLMDFANVIYDEHQEMLTFSPYFINNDEVHTKALPFIQILLNISADNMQLIQNRLLEQQAQHGGQEYMVEFDTDSGRVIKRSAIEDAIVGNEQQFSSTSSSSMQSGR